MASTPEVNLISNHQQTRQIRQDQLSIIHVKFVVDQVCRFIDLHKNKTPKCFVATQTLNTFQSQSKIVASVVQSHPDLCILFGLVDGLKWMKQLLDVMQPTDQQINPRKIVFFWEGEGGINTSIPNPITRFWT